MAAWEPSTSRVPYDDGDVVVETVGGGPVPCVLITPVGAPWLLGALPEELGDLLTIHILELPGTGRSGGAAEEATVGGVADAVERAISHLGLRAPVLFGHSMNGTLALAAAATLGERLRGVIVVASPPRLPIDGEAQRQYWEEHADAERKRRSAELVEAAQGATDQGETTRLWAEASRILRWYDLDFDPAALDALADLDEDWVQAVMADAAALDWDGVLQLVHCPVLLVLGQHDYMSPPSLWQPSSPLDDATVEVLPRSSHTPFYEEPEAFVAAVRAWLPRLVTSG
jgi:proline iminopeptidase